MAAPAAADEQLLERHRPLLRYDAQEEYFAQPARRPQDPQRIGTDRVYGHVAEQDGRTWLQYWLFFAENTQDRGVVATGRHQGDWELVQVGLGPESEAKRVTFSQHSSAEECAIDSVEVVDGAPAVYVANGSHALYPRPGTADRPFPDPNDEADGAGREVRPPVVSGDGEWSEFDGRWGASRAGFVPGEQSSPVGPPFQSSGVWERPASYAAGARSCGSDPPGRWWALPALVFVLAAIAVLVGRRVRG
jgi:hypothetical protein